ncbi:MAG: aminotransferase class V-fold PLP-dependent enzyme [Alphaproteobacteria bacterium]|nr:aminotransferase class V-fold PLP-dependent enzyme [Alphaproteobacteria bacterium]
MKDAVRRAAALAIEHLESVERQPVRPKRDADSLRAALLLAPPARGCDVDELADRLASVMAATPVTISRRFFNQLFGGADPGAILGEMVVPVLNNSLYTFKVAGPHVLVEEALIRHMLPFAGFEGGDGAFTPGGSLSNFVAMLVARNEALPGTRERGLDGRVGVIYSSAEAHYSVRKAAGMLGMGRQNVRGVPVDARGGMRPDALAEAIRADRAEGRVPVMINATAGTTVRGAVDPIDAIADVAAAEGVWLHVDGAWGGSIVLSERHRGLLRGLHRADSFTWDAHKMMGVPLTCSVALFRKPDILRAHLSEVATYLFQADGDRLNPGTRSLQCGRRNDALKLWCGWQLHGDAGYARRIDALLDLARYAAEAVDADPELVLAEAPQTANVCFEVPGRSSAAICERLYDEGLAMVGTGEVCGRNTIRLVCVNPDQTTEDIDALLAAVKAVAASLPAEDDAA